LYDALDVSILNVDIVPEDVNNKGKGNNHHHQLKAPAEANKDGIKTTSDVANTPLTHTPSDVLNSVQSLNQMLLTSKYIPGSVAKFGGMKKWNEEYIKKLYEMTQLIKEKKLYDSKRTDKTLFSFLTDLNDSETYKSETRKFSLKRNDISPFHSGNLATDPAAVFHSEALFRKELKRVFDKHKKKS